MFVPRFFKLAFYVLDFLVDLLELNRRPSFLAFERLEFLA